ncbi:MAG: hypothetical protein P8H03_00570 [Emcibacteraceae bacterium]|nr:hypothetical protein [Emcibacteraceae bacterium]
MTATAEREIAVNNLINQTKSLAGPTDVSRENLQKIRTSLENIASIEKYWCETEFPAPTGDKVQTRYLISQDDDDSYALYLNVMHTGKVAPPHNHTTWACIAAVEGEEYNYRYEPVEAGPLHPGDREIKQTETIVVKPGQGIDLLPDDIHSIAIHDGVSTRHLHFYGRGLETLDKRLMWDKSLKACQYFVMDVKTTK